MIHPFATHSEVDVKTSEVFEKLTKTTAGFKGSIAIADTPTEAGFYFATEVGTYANAGGLVTEAGKLNILTYDGTTWDVVKIDMPKGIKNWDSDLGLTYPSIRIHKNNIWRVVKGKTTSATDEPNLNSSVWQKITNDPIDVGYLKYNKIPLKYTGSLDENKVDQNGNVIGDPNWDLYDLLPIKNGGGKDVVIESDTSSSWRFGALDINKDGIQELDGQSQIEGTGEQTYKFTLPAGTEYLALYRRNIINGDIFHYNVRVKGAHELNNELGDELFNLEDVAHIRRKVYIPTYTGINNNRGLSSNGGIEPRSSFDLYDLLYVPNSGEKEVEFICDISGAYRFGALDENKNGIQRLDGDNQRIGTKDVRYVFTLPAGTEYLALYRQDNLANKTYNWEVRIEGKYVLFDENEDEIIDLTKLSENVSDEVINQIKIANQFKYQQLEQQISNIVPNPITPYYFPRPQDGVVNFQVPVNCGIADFQSNTLNNQEVVDIHYDWGILLLPTNYSQAGNPVKLVIANHGTGTWYNGNSTSTTHSAALLSQGYAVMDMNGIPASFVGSNGQDIPDKRHYGSPIALQSYIKGYHHVTEKYNISKEGCFVYGQSMGGLSSFMLVMSGSIPVIAQGAFCPCIDLYKQAYVNPWNGATQREQIADYFGFNGTKPTFTNSYPPTQAEIDYFMDNKDKWIGYNSMTKHVANLDITTMYNTIPPESQITNTTEEAEYDNFYKMYETPLKIWHNQDDTTVRWRYSKYFVDMVRKSGGLAKLRTFPSGGHNAWKNGEIVHNIPTIDGGTTSMFTSTYEMIKWFERFN